MSIRTVGRLRALALIAGVFGLVLGSAAAAENKGAQKPAKEASGDTTIAPREALRRGALALWAIETSKGKVAQYLVEAQRKKDVIRINCVQEKLSRLNSVVEIARDTLKRLRVEAPKDEAGDTSRLLYEKLMLLKEQAEGLRRDAEACSGEEMSYTGSTRIFVEQDKSIPREDPSDPPSGFNPVREGVDRLPETSPYL